MSGDLKYPDGIAGKNWNKRMGRKETLGSEYKIAE